MTSASLLENPTRRLFGNGVFTQLPELIATFRPTTILLVLGEKSFRRSHHFQKLQSYLPFYNVIEATPVSQNPTAAFIQEEINRLKTFSYDLVLAIGGGSVLDVSKILASIPKQTETQFAHYLNGSFEIPTKPAPVIAIPTTSGTGSEVTPYASLETPEKKKITVSHPLFYPTVALIDPELTYSMPEYVTACTGFDALSQAIESFWAVSATQISRAHALKAIELIAPNLQTAFREPLNAEARAHMSLGSCEAGLAIAYTKTTAVHSVSYPITALFGVAHGHACALTLPEFIRFNASVMKESGLPMLKRLNADSYESAAQQVESLMTQTHVERSLAKLGIDEKGRALIVRDGFRPDRVLNNPRKLTAEDLEKILSSIA